MAGQRRPAAMADPAARAVVPFDRADPGGGRRDLPASRRPRRGRPRRQRDPPFRRPLRAGRPRRDLAAGRARSGRRAAAAAGAAAAVAAFGPPCRRHRRDDPSLARQRRAAAGARPRRAAGRHHGAGPAPQRLSWRIVARAEAAPDPGRRRRSPGPDRTARGPGPDRARPVPVAAGRRSDPGDGVERAVFRHRRGAEPLWSRLRAADDPDLRQAAARLSALRARADFAPPYELYAELLGAGGGRRALLERLGSEAADPVEEFLSLALAYERDHVPSLQGFLRWLETGESEI